MTVAILQPSYLPWIGYFQQIKRADTFVYYDDVQYTKNDWRNRNRIKISEGYSWLSIPVSFSLGERICDIYVGGSWKKKHLRTLQQVYGKSLYFAEVYALIEKTLLASSPKLSTLCVELTEEIKHYMGMSTVSCLASSLDIQGERSERLLKICKVLKATRYFTGAASKAYLNEEIFRKENITVEYQDFYPTPYPQHGEVFLPYLSIVDLLFNCGKKSYDYL
jgi:hypothetical protein